MAAHNRLNGTPFTCKNARFWTDTSKGHPHGVGQVGGSLFMQPLAPGQGGNSLWVEHVVDRDNPGAEIFWMMWHSSSGDPTIAGSSVMSLDEIKQMTRNLADFLSL